MKPEVAESLIVHTREVKGREEGKGKGSSVVTLESQPSPRPAALDCPHHHSPRAVSSPNLKRVRSIASSVQFPPEPEVSRMQERVRIAVEQPRSPEAATTPFQENASKAETQRQVWSGRTRIAAASKIRVVGVQNVSTLNLECLSETRTAFIVYQFPPEPEGGRESDGC